MTPATDFGIVGSLFHNDQDVYGGARTARDRLPSRNRYFYEVWAESVTAAAKTDVPVIIVNNASPAHPDNFFWHWRNFEIIENGGAIPRGSKKAHFVNHTSAIREGFKALRTKGIKYGVHVEQDLLLGGNISLPDCIRRMHEDKADLMAFRLADHGWLSTELFISRVDFWLDHELMSASPPPWRRTFHTEELLDVQLRKIKHRLIDWNELQSARDTHPDPCGVNGFKYTHHRFPEELLRFLDESLAQSDNVRRLKEFISKKCL